MTLSTTSSTTASSTSWGGEYAPIPPARPRFRRRRLGEDLELGSRNARALHQRLGERLARLDATRSTVRPEDVEACMAQCVADTCIDRGLGAEHDEAEPLALREVD